MNKKLAKKYLEMIAEDAGYGFGRKSTAHECHAEKRKCPLKQEEFDFGGNNDKGAADYAKYLKGFREWAGKQRNPDVLSAAMKKYGENDDIAEILSKAWDALFRTRAEDYVAELGERL